MLSRLFQVFKSLTSNAQECKKRIRGHREASALMRQRTASRRAFFAEDFSDSLVRSSFLPSPPKRKAGETVAEAPVASESPARGLRP